ncbi:hypothetical protein GCM10010102_01890 [Promicromonospora citrea]|uniref:Uncharacterized protein n=1 Tax=Promicromonospora citrea TaxID=43677 RepID=A0A8H9GD45_9MICO|nr:hypothetical protein GCM10010102_01890 [Promicromonospora citrea]
MSWLLVRTYFLPARENGMRLPPMMTASRVDGTGEGVVDTSLFLLTRSHTVVGFARGGAQDSQYLILSVP